jgi:hypothetical protein
MPNSPASAANMLWCIPRPLQVRKFASLASLASRAPQPRCEKMQIDADSCMSDETRVTLIHDTRSRQRHRERHFASLGPECVTLSRHRRGVSWFLPGHVSSFFPAKTPQWKAELVLLVRIFPTPHRWSPSP